MVASDKREEGMARIWFNHHESDDMVVGCVERRRALL